MWYMSEADATIVVSVKRSDETMDNHSNNVLLAVLTSLFPETFQSL
jgi:hypothetical protein